LVSLIGNKVAEPPTSVDHDEIRRRLLAAPPMAVPDVDELAQELDEIRGRRA
jgi:hypothetical protein